MNKAKDAARMKTEIIYEDDQVLVAYKPAGLAVQAAGIGQIDMVSELKNYLHRKQKKGRSETGKVQEPYLGIVHRLDQPVEGLLVFGKTKQAAAALSRQLQKGEDGEAFHKDYCAVVCGKPAKAEAELTDFLVKDKGNIAVVVEQAAESGEPAQAKKAVLRYRVRETAMSDQLALVDIHLQTGRFHQIRAQMAHAGLPLLGDMKYGAAEALQAARALGVSQVSLCACRLEFPHPVSGEKLSFHVKPRGRAFSFFQSIG